MWVMNVGIGFQEDLMGSRVWVVVFYFGTLW